MTTDQGERLSANLRRMYDDMIEQYNKDRINENSVGMERLAKVIRDLAKQIREHELHERETVRLSEVVKWFRDLGVLHGKLAYEMFSDEQATAFLQEFHNRGQELLNVEM